MAALQVSASLVPVQSPLFTESEGPVLAGIPGRVPQPDLRFVDARPARRPRRVRARRKQKAGRNQF
jgi:hypothetical protein